MIKNIILTSFDEIEKQKGYLSIETTTQKTLVSIKLFNVLSTEKLVLGIKTGGEYYKVKLSNATSSYIIEKPLDLTKKISAVVVEIAKNSSKILVWGSNETSKVWQNSILFDVKENELGSNFFNSENKSLKNEEDIDKNKIDIDKINQDKENNIKNKEKINENEENFDENAYSTKIFSNFKDDQINFDNENFSNDYESDEEIEKLVDENMQNESEFLDEENNFNEENEDNLNNSGDFLSSVKEQIDELLLTNPHEEALENLILNSTFVKVEKDDGNYYVFGVIKENDEISYIVYGIAGEFNVKPDDEFKDYYQWLPLNPDSPEGYGYYLMYQDATNGGQIEMILE